MGYYPRPAAWIDEPELRQRGALPWSSMVVPIVLARPGRRLLALKRLRVLGSWPETRCVMPPFSIVRIVE
jgi:hypothetical protein